MKRWFAGIGEFLSKAWFSVPVLLTALIGYGYGLTHEALHVDDLALSAYFEKGLLMEQGRVGSILLSAVTGIDTYRAGTMQLIGLLFLILAAAGFCSLMRTQSGDRLQKPVYPLFACLLISCPMIPAIWVYDYQAMSMGVCYFLTVAALAMACLWVESPRGGYGYAAGAAALMLFILTIYEAFAAVYICAVCFLLLLRVLHGAPDDQRLTVVLVNGMKFAGVLAIAAGIRALAFPVFGYAPVAWATLFKTLFVYFAVAAKWYLPVRILLCAVAALVIWGLVKGVRQSKTVWLLVAGMCVSLLLLSVATRSFKGYRACQVVWFFVAAVALLLTQDVLAKANRRWVRTGVVLLLSLLCFRQAVDLDRWLHVDVQRYREEKQVLTQVYHEVAATCGLDKPVEFIGLYELSDAVMEQCAVTKDDPACRYAFKLLGTDAAWFCYADSAVYAYLRDGLTAFYPGEMLPGEMLAALLRYNGMQHLRVGTEKMYWQANRMGADMPCWPAPGAIVETEAFTIVKLGELWIPPDRAEPLFSDG